MFKEKLQTQPENKEQNGNKYTSINNHFKCQLNKCSNQKTQVADWIKKKKKKKQDPSICCHFRTNSHRD